MTSESRSEGVVFDDSGWDDLVGIEERMYDEGFAAGRRDARQAGFEQARDMGLDHGQKIGREVGFYLGFVALIKETLTNDSPPKLVRAVKTLDEQLLDYAPIDPTNEDLQDRLQRIRGKFKLVRNLLSMSKTLAPGGKAMVNVNSTRTTENGTGGEGLSF